MCTNQHVEGFESPVRILIRAQRRMCMPTVSRLTLRSQPIGQKSTSGNSAERDNTKTYIYFQPNTVFWIQTKISVRLVDYDPEEPAQRISGYEVLEYKEHSPHPKEGTDEQSPKSIIQRSTHSVGGEWQWRWRWGKWCA